MIARIRAETASGGYEVALKLVNEKLQEASLKATWYQRRAEIYRASGREDKAIADLEKALEELDGIFKRRPVPIHQVTRARVLRLLGRLEEARQQLVEVLANAPLADPQDLAQMCHGGPFASTPMGESGMAHLKIIDDKKKV